MPSTFFPVHERSFYVKQVHQQSVHTRSMPLKSKPFVVAAAIGSPFTASTKTCPSPSPVIHCAINIILKFLHAVFLMLNKTNTC